MTDLVESWATNGPRMLPAVCGHQPGEWHSVDCRRDAMLADAVRRGLTLPPPAAAGMTCYGCGQRLDRERCAACPLLPRPTPAAAPRPARRGWRASLRHFVERLLR